MSKISLLVFSIALIVSVATSNILREGRISGAERLNDPEISKCLDKKNCPVTMDFRPTCASDGKTYVNHAIIRCLNECLKADEQLTIVSGGYCKDDAPQPASKL